MILADVVGHTGPEIAEILELSPANVRQILTRARATLRELQAVPGHGGGVQSRDGGEILNAFMVALASDDVQALTELLARDVAFRSDSAGQYRAANNVVSGRDAVIALLRGLVRHGTAPAWSSMVEVNGQRAMAMRWPDDVGDERQSRRCVLLLTPTKVGIGAVSLVLADRKLCTIDFGQG